MTETTLWNKRGYINRWGDIDYYKGVKSGTIKELKDETIEITWEEPMEGRKNDQGKLRMDLVPVTAMRAMARGFGYGADKYEAWNWTKGLSTGRLYGALLRHLTAWWDGEEMDQESGLSHLDHVLCCAAMLEGTVTGGLGEDDRPRKTQTDTRWFQCPECRHLYKDRNCSC